MCCEVFIRVWIHRVKSSTEERPIAWVNKPPPEKEDFLCKRPKQKRLPPTVCLVLSEESTPSVIFTGYDPVLQDEPSILVMLIRFAARGMYIPCRLRTETGEKTVLHFCHLVWGQDCGAEELARSEQPPLPQALRSFHQQQHLTCSKRRSSGWWCLPRRRSRTCLPSQPRSG